MKQQIDITNSALAPNYRPAVRVLLVEDDDHYSQFIERVLTARKSEFNFKLTRVRDLSSAINERIIQNPDVILLDLNLSDSNGLETLKKLNEHGFGSPVIVLTGRDDQAAGLESIALGAQDYLVKQVISSESLVRSILYAIERRKSELSRLRWGAIRDFSAILANDLQVPLIGTRNLLDVLVSTSDIDSQARGEILSVLKKSNAEQIELISRLLEVYQYETKQLNLVFSECNLNDLVCDVLEKLDSRLTSNLKLNLDVPNGLCIWADRTAFHKVILNLLDNAMRYGTSGAVELIAQRNADSTTIQVRTPTNVIPPDELRSLFMGFWQGIPGKKYVASVGLGLYLCQQIIDLHNGEINCQSRKDEGTTFTVTLPALASLQSFTP